MKCLTEYLWFHTTKQREYINITDRVAGIVDRSGIRDGMVLVSAMHITAGVYVNDAEDGLIQDIDEWLEKLAPFNVKYRHHRTGETNGDAHLKNFSLLETKNGDYVLSPAYDLMNTRIHVEDEDGFFALNDELFKEWNWSDCRIKNDVHHPCKNDFIEFGKVIEIAEKRINKLLEPFLLKQKGIEDLVKKSFLDKETQTQYLKFYSERLAMLNSI